MSTIVSLVLFHSSFLVLILVTLFLIMLLFLLKYQIQFNLLKPRKRIFRLWDQSEFLCSPQMENSMSLYSSLVSSRSRNQSTPNFILLLLHFSLFIALKVQPRSSFVFFFFFSNYCFTECEILYTMSTLLD